MTTPTMKTAAPAPAPEKHLTRTGIMLVLAPVVEAALKTIPGLTLTLTGGEGDTAARDNIRRAYRALLHLGIKLMLDAGAPPEVVAGEAMTAIGNELKERQEKAKVEGFTQNAPTLPS